MSLLNYWLITAPSLVLMISVLVVVHEWGHFIVARLFKIRVDEFSLGFGPRMFRVGKRGDTEYNVRWILLGGYVKIAGMEPDEAPIIDARDRAKALLAGDPNRSEVPLVAENTPDKAEDEMQRERDSADGFYSKPAWQRALVIFAGPLMSFILGVVLLCSFGFTFGIADRTLNTVEKVNPGSAAQHMGLRAGDEILAVNAAPVTNGDEMVSIIHASDGKPVTLTIERGNRTIMLTGTPQIAKDDDGQPDLINGKPYWILGFVPSDHYRRIPVGASIKLGLKWTGVLLQNMGHLFTHVNALVHQTGGIVEVTAATHDAAQGGPIETLQLWALLTISLAIFNLLPIPVLDGGHLLIIAIEGLRRGKRLTLEQQQRFMLAGLAIIATIFILMTTRGIYRLIEGKLPHF